MYSIQHYVIKFVSDLLQVGGILRVLRFSTNKSDRHDVNWNIVENVVKHHTPQPNQELTIRRNWQDCAHKTQDEDKQNKKHNTEN